MTDRDSVLNQAIRSGKIAASDRDHYARMYDRLPTETRRLLTARVEEGGLMPGLRGSGEDPATAAPGGYDPSWLSPLERERINAANRPHPTPNAPRPSPKQTAAGAVPAASDEYPTDALSPAERERIAAAREGRLVHDRIHVEGD